MSHYENFAVIGAGNLGGYVIDALLKVKSDGLISSVIVISGSEAASKHPEWVKAGAIFRTVDYDSPSATSFEGVEVAISTASGPVIAKQQGLAVAAKAAGVQLFVPSEFGDPTDKATQGELFLIKKALQNKLKELDLPYSLYFTGMWIDWIFSPFWGWDLENGKVHIGGEGNTPISFTGREDIITFLVHTLTTLPPSKLQWSIFRIEGERATFNDVAARYQEKTGKKLEVSHTPQAVLKENVSKDPWDLVSLLTMVWDQGEGAVGDVNAFDFYPEWKPKKIFNILGQ